MPNEEFEKQAILPLIPLAMGALSLYSAYSGVNNLRKGNYGEAAFDALGVIPGLGVLKGIKGVGLAAKAIQSARSAAMATRAMQGTRALGTGAKAGWTAARGASMATKGIKAVQGGETVFRASHPLDAAAKGMYYGTRNAYQAAQAGKKLNVVNRVGQGARAAEQQAVVAGSTPSFMQPHVNQQAATHAKIMGDTPIKADFLKPYAEGKGLPTGVTQSTPAATSAASTAAESAASTAAEPAKVGLDSLANQVFMMGSGGGGGAAPYTPSYGPPLMTSGPIRGVSSTPNSQFYYGGAAQYTPRFTRNPGRN